MKTYTIRSQTPLAFHGFYRFFLLPLRIILTLVTIFSIWENRNTVPTWAFWMDVGFQGGILLLCLVTFIGFWFWASYGWNCLMVLLAFGPLYQIVLLALFRFSLPGSMSLRLLVNLLGQVAHSVLVGMYYKKRKPLFFPELVQRRYPSPPAQEEP